MNVVVLRGELSSAPRVRELPSGSVLWCYEVSTSSDDGSRIGAPVVWLDPARPPRVDAGDEVVVVGSVRRRFFRTPAGTASRTEVAAEVVGRVGARRVARAVEAVADRIGATTARD